MEVVRTMLHDQDLPMHVWAEAARTVVYVQNHTPHRVLENKTLEEVFSGKKPEVSHLKIFGCPVYIHIPKEKRTKLDPSGKKGIFVGYNDTSKAYKIYFPGFKKIETIETLLLMKTKPTTNQDKPTPKNLKNVDTERGGESV